MSSLVVIGLPFTIPSPVDRTRGRACRSLRSCVRTVVIPSVRGGLQRKFKHTVQARASAYIISVLSFQTMGNKGCRRSIVYTLPPYRVTRRLERIRSFVHDQGNIRCCLWRRGSPFRPYYLYFVFKRFCEGDLMRFLE